MSKNSNYTFTSKWKPFTTSKEELRKMMADIGEFKFEANHILINNYIFKPSTLVIQIKATDIKNIALQSTPPTIRVRDELYFISASLKNDLALFAYTHNIPTVDRIDIWSWIAEPFLDTEYTDDTHIRLNNLLLEYGLTNNEVYDLRKNIETQMLKYNFDTMLWEWVHLGLYDVLKAIRPKYSSIDFHEFYKKAMQIALRAEEKEMK